LLCACVFVFVSLLFSFLFIIYYLILNARINLAAVLAVASPLCLVTRRTRRTQIKIMQRGALPVPPARNHGGKLSVGLTLRFPGTYHRPQSVFFNAFCFFNLTAPVHLFGGLHLGVDLS
jgi:hypothetical protein